MNDYNIYIVLDSCTHDKVRGALQLALEMAKESYPHLVDTIQFAYDRDTENAESFIGTQNKPVSKPAYRKEEKRYSRIKK